MDSSQPGAPTSWHRNMTAGDALGTSHKADLARHAIDAAGAIVPTPPSPKLDYHQHVLPRHLPRHLWPDPSRNLAKGVRPPTPPCQDTNHGFSDLRHWYSRNQHARPPQAPPRLRPFADLLPSPKQQITQLTSMQASPPIQRWPTHNLVDAKTPKKQEEFRKKAEAKRTGPRLSEHRNHAKLALHHGVAPEHTPISTRMPGKRRAGFINTAPPNLLLPLRRPSSVYEYDTRDSPGFSYRSPYTDTSRHNPIPSQPPFDDHTSANHGQRHPFDTCGQQKAYNNFTSIYGDASRRPLPQVEAVPRPEPADREALYQTITDNYHDYKWPVKLYELHAGSSFDSAYTYMETWFEQSLYLSEECKWHAHTTTGFIKEGNRFSILALHNAVDPFKWGQQTESTTSIGVYGRYAHTHEEIHWTTISPNIQDFFDRCPDVTVKQKWHVDMTKASEKRFHRAYWLAANMRPLKGLLNHNLVPGRPHDAMEDEDTDEGFGVDEDDLQCAWNGGQPSMEKCDEAWQRILNEVGSKDVYELGSEHITIGGTERMDTIISG